MCGDELMTTRYGAHYHGGRLYEADTCDICAAAPHDIDGTPLFVGDAIDLVEIDGRPTTPIRGEIARFCDNGWEMEVNHDPAQVDTTIEPGTIIGFDYWPIKEVRKVK